jgi:putative chitobiose transport system permease protein
MLPALLLSEIVTETHHLAWEADRMRGMLSPRPGRRRGADAVRAPSGTAGRAGGHPLTPYVFLAPGLILFGVFFAWPTVLAVQISFTDYSVVRPTTTVGLDNYTELWRDASFRSAVVNSFVVMVGLLPFSVVIPLLLAVLVNRRLRGVQFFRAVYFLPVVMSMVAVAVAWRYVFDDRGVLNWLLLELGWVESPVHFLLDPRWSLASVILVEGWKGIGTYMMIYLAGLQSISGDVYEAARIDGARGHQRLLYITVPLIRPFIAVAVTIEFVNAMQVFTSVYVLTRGGPSGSSTTAGYFVWSEAFEQYRFGYASAAGVIIWAVLVLLAVLNHRVTARAER